LIVAGVQTSPLGAWPITIHLAALATLPGIFSLVCSPQTTPARSRVQE